MVNLLRQGFYYISLCYWNQASLERIKTMQLNKFRKIFSHARNHSRFYHQLYESAGILDLEIRSFDDIKKVPVIDKYDLKEFGFENILTVPLSQSINEHATSGTSGEPLKLYYNKYEDYTAHTRVYYALRKAANYTPFKKIVMITRYEEDDRFQVEEDLSVLQKMQKYLGIFNREIISIYRDPDYIIDRINQAQPYILWSTPSIMEIVVNRMIEKNVAIQIPYLFFTSETISPIQYAKFIKYVSENVVDVYGTMESPCLGYEVNKSGKRILYPNSNLFEIINIRDSEIGKVGDVVLTNLINYTMPIIRYDLKDIAYVLEDADFPNKVLGDIIGRLDDILEFPDGNQFAHHHAHEMFMDFEECDQFKFVQKDGEAIKLQLKANKRFTKEEITTKALKRWNKRFSQYHLDIEFVDCFEIHPETGKLKNMERKFS